MTMTPQEKANELAVSMMADGLRDKQGINQRKAIEAALTQMHEWTKNKLLKNATDITIDRYFLYHIKPYIHEKYLDYKIGEKVKWVLIKEEEL